MSSVPGIRSDFFVIPISIVHLCIERQRPNKSSLKILFSRRRVAARPNLLLKIQRICHPDRSLSECNESKGKWRDLLFLRLASEQMPEMCRDAPQTRYPRNECPL